MTFFSPCRVITAPKELLYLLNHHLTGLQLSHRYFHHEISFFYTLSSSTIPDYNFDCLLFGMLHLCCSSLLWIFILLTLVMVIFKGNCFLHQIALYIYRSLFSLLQVLVFFFFLLYFFRCLQVSHFSVPGNVVSNNVTL